jgi:antitoxin component HigA of HigAB toxin-antitoxin module
MKSAHQAVHFKKLPKTYSALVGLHMPRPIRDKTSYDSTMEMIDALAGSELNEDQEDYLDLLGQIVETYEKENLKPYPKLSGLAALRYLLSENKMSGDDLAVLLGIDRSNAYKILKGTRNLTAAHICKLGQRFRVSSDLFLTIDGIMFGEQARREGRAVSLPQVKRRFSKWLRRPKAPGTGSEKSA